MSHPTRKNFPSIANTQNMETSPQPDIDPNVLSETLCEPPGSPRGLFDRLKYAAEVIGQVDMASNARPWLAYRRADRSIGHYPLAEGSTRVGRKAEGGLSVEDAYLSRQHFEVAQMGKDFCLRDMDSLGGVRINGEPLSGERTLVSGDLIEAGTTVFIYVEFFPEYGTLSA